MGERTTDPEKSTTFQNKGFRVQKVCSETERETKRGSEGLRRVMILSDPDLHCVQDKTAQNRSTSYAVILSSTESKQTFHGNIIFNINSYQFSLCISSLHSFRAQKEMFCRKFHTMKSEWQRDCQAPIKN